MYSYDIDQSEDFTDYVENMESSIIVSISCKKAKDKDSDNYDADMFLGDDIERLSGYLRKNVSLIAQAMCIASYNKYS